MDQNALIQQRDQELANIYNPQVQLLEQQMQALPGQFAGQRSSLEQAKINAFRDIGNQAQRQGMFFSGFKPAEQGRYLGEKFLPGLQELQVSEEQSKMGLMGQITGLRGQQAEARMTFLEKLRQEQAERQEQIRLENLAQQQKEQDRQFEMQTQQRQAATSRGDGQTAPAQQNPFEGYSIQRKDNQAGFAFTGPGNRPISMAQYAEATGVGLTELLRQSESQYDKQALADIQKLEKQGWPERIIQNNIRQRYPALF